MNISISINEADELGLEAYNYVKEKARKGSNSFSNEVRNALVDIMLEDRQEVKVPTKIKVKKNG